MKNPLSAGKKVELALILVIAILFTQYVVLTWHYVHTYREHILVKTNMDSEDNR